MTVVQREKLAELVKEFDAVLKPGGDHLPRHSADRGVALQQPPRARLRHPHLACALPKDTKHRQVYGDRLAPMIADAFDANPKLAWKNCESVRFSDED
jgi:hypothetical protein